jgi:phytoene dehydrogenase-like protein
VAAHLLARAGREVLLIEESTAANDVMGWVPPPLVRELELELKIEAPDPWLTVPLPQGGRLELSRDMGRTVEALRRVSPRDAAKWPEFCRRMAHIARLFEVLYLAPAELPTSLGMALKVRRLGRKGMEDLMRLLPMSVAELLDDWFESDALKGALAAMGILHLQQGPRSGGTAFRLLHHHVGSAEGVFRPARSNLASALRQGVKRRQAKVAKILIKSGRVTGVALGHGEELAASLVVSGLDPCRTLLELADPGWLDPELARALAHVRRRGIAARVSFRNVNCAPLVFAPALDYLERAYDESKYGRVSREPYLEVSPADGGIEVHFQYAPYHCPWDDTRRAELAETTRSMLASHIPAIPEVEASVLAPPDLEEREGWPQGQAYHAELTLDQALWMRPVPELARYRTPLDGLWLCGPGSHPGGGIAGASGRNCVHQILQSR